MITTISMTKMSTADAIVVNEKIQAAVADCTASFGAATVGQPVLEGAALLAEKTGPLNTDSKKNYEHRRRIDMVSDRCLGSIYSVCESKQEAFEQPLIPLSEAQQTELAAARQILQLFFPEGKGFIKGRWSEQYGATEMILDQAGRSENASLIESLGLCENIDLLGKVHKLYGDAMGYTAVVAQEEESPLNQWHEALESYLAAVIFTQRKNKELKARLTAPYETIAQAVRDANRRARRSTPAAVDNPV